MAVLTAGLENYSAIVQHMDLYAGDAIGSVDSIAINGAISVQAFPILTGQVQQIVALVSLLLWGGTPTPTPGAHSTPYPITCAPHLRNKCDQWCGGFPGYEVASRIRWALAWP